MKKFFSINRQKICSLAVTFLLLQAPLQAAGDALYIYFAGGQLERSISLDDVQRLTFSNDNLLLKTTNGNETPYALASVEKITFEKILSGIPDINGNIEITLYPNPAVNDVTISSPADIILWTLFDINGKTLQQAATSNVQMSHLPAGIYFIKILTEQGTVVKKIIKQ